MPYRFLEKILPRTIPQKICGTLFLLIVSYNILRLVQYIHKLRPLIPLAQLVDDGRKFAEFKDTLKNQTYVSYITNKDLKNSKHAKQFSQAQYTLAPSILDDKKLSHKYGIVDCTNERVAEAVIHQLKAVPLKKNNFGIYLIQLKP